jgi:ECF transporter S component (folate family)
MESNATKTTPKPTKRNYVNHLVLAALFVALSAILKLTFEIYFLPTLRFNFATVPIMVSGMVLGPIWGFAVGALSDIINFILKPTGPFHYGFTLATALNGFIPGLIFWLAKKRKKEFNYSVLNIVMYVILVGGMLWLLNAYDIIAFENGQILLKENVVPWYSVAIVLILFAAYAFFTLYFLRKKEKAGKKMPVPADKVLFAVTSVEIIASLLLNTIFLVDLYGAGTTFIGLLPLRLVKSIFVIPIFAFVCYILCNLIAKYKLQKK